VQVRLMANMQVIVDGSVVMDGDMGQWIAEPPGIASLKLQAAKKDRPWARHILLIVAEAGMSDRATNVNVTTDDDGAFTLEVDYPRGLTV
jgi:hypothetical protein